MNRRIALFSTISFTLVLLAVLGISLTARAAQGLDGPARPQAVLLADDFDYGSTAMSLTIASGGIWANHSGTSPYVGYTTTSLSMAGYGSSGVGGAATVATNGSEDVNRSFAPQASGTVYFAALVRVSAAGAGTYFMHLKDATTSGFRARVFAKLDVNVLRFGLDTSSGTGVYATGVYTYNTTYLLVTKHSLDTGATALYVLDSFTPTEPGSPDVSFTAGTTLTISSVAFRQAAGGPSAIIDGVRVATTWADVVGYVPPPEANLGVGKSGPDIVGAGDPITYTISISNSGNLTATGTLVTDTLPTDVTYMTYTSSLPASFTQAGQTLVWDLGDVASGASGTITLQGTVAAGASGGAIFTNTVTASTTATETQLTNNAAEWITHVAVPDLDVYKTGPATASAGDPIEYTISVANLGTATAPSSVVTDTLPAEVNFMTYTASLPASFSQAGQTLVWDLGNVAVGASGLITVQGTIAPATSNGTTFTNTVAASSTTPEVVTTNNSDTWTTLVGAPDLVLVKTGPASVLVGDPVVYTLDYSNTGDLNATSVVLVDHLPAGLTYVSDSRGTGTLVGNTITWTLGTVATNASGSLVLTATAVTLGDKANMAVISSALSDSNPEDNTAVFTTTVQGGDPYVVKSGPARLFGGDVVSYTITYGNHGDLPAAVTITDTLPLSFTIVNDTSGLPFVDAGNTRSWTTTIPASATGLSFTLAVQVPTSVATGTLVTNTLTVDTAVAGNDPSNDRAEVGSTVYQFTSIHDIQYVNDPDISDTSSYSGTWVVVEGVVIANPSSFLSASGLPYRYYIEDPAGGPWSGLYIYRGTANPPGVVEGDFVRLYGYLVEFVQGGSNQTELDLSRTGAFQMVLSSGNPLPAPANLLTEDFVNAGTAEQWESVLIEFQNALVTNPNISNGEWKFNNSNGDAIGDDNAKAGGNTVFTYVPQLNDHYKFIRGIGNQSFGTYKIEPRYNADVVLDFPVTFAYHDLEDVVQPGEDVQLRGDFTNWGTNPITLAHDAGYTVFSATVTLPTTATQSYKYYVTNLSGNAGWDMLNTNNRSVAPARGLTQQNEYRNVTIGWGNLNGPASQTVNLGSSTASIDGQVYVQEVTNPDGAGRGLKAELGYGSSADPANWTWSAMAFASQTGNNDVYAGVITPAASGVYSYATRYNGNWGTGNPNSQWVYADLDGVPFSLDKTGVLTVTAPQLAIYKSVATTHDLAELGDVVTYTLTLSNTGDGTATGVLITDVLPSALNFGGFVQQNGAAYGSGVITWGGSTNAGTAATVIFTATVKNDKTLYGTDVLNTVQFTSGNDGNGSASIAFALVKRYFTYLPLIKR
jgi:uncharacterized repeat protein (TIGR01451 family)